MHVSLMIAQRTFCIIVLNSHLSQNVHTVGKIIMKPSEYVMAIPEKQNCKEKVSR